MSQAATLDVAAPKPQAKSGWLYSPVVDLAVLGLPVFFVALAFSVGRARGSQGLEEREYAALVSQYLLGNTTHVVLTFVAIGVRRDLLAPVAGQKSILVFGSIAAFLASFLLFWGTAVTAPRWVEFGTTIGIIFAQQHRLSQVKGVWALYSLRAKQAPSPLERTIQRVFVPSGLLLLVMRMLVFPRSATTTFAVLVPIPGVPPPLPFFLVYVLIAGYAIFAAVGIYALRRAHATFPKTLYVSAHFAIVLFSLYEPLWGSLIWGGVHGLEYFLISGRLLQTRDGDTRRLSPPMIVVMMITAVAPLATLGLLSAPFMHGRFGESMTVRVAFIAMNSLVMAHYFADAFLYRLRIPQVRKVVLSRMGML